MYLINRTQFWSKVFAKKKHAIVSNCFCCLLACVTSFKKVLTLFLFWMHEFEPRPFKS
eukprot:UN26523